MQKEPPNVNRTRSDQGQSFDRELSRRIVRSSMWVGVGHGGSQIISFAGTLILVRLLDPQAFGTVAIGMTLLAVIFQIQESGLSAAYIHGRHRDPRVAASSVLVFAAAAGFVLTVVTVAVAPLYTRLLHVPDATSFVQVLALLLAIRGLAVVPGAMLERELDFRSRTRAELSGALVQVTVAVSCAVSGMGAWSLVAGVIAGTSTQMSVMWLQAPWRPSPFAASRAALVEMLRYGRFVSGTNVMVVVNGNLDNAVVARFLGTATLGVYNIAWRLAELPNTFIAIIVGRVMFSVYSRLQHDLAAVRAAYVQNLQRMMLLALPVTVALGLAAEPLVLGLLGPQWEGAIDPLRLLAIFGFIRLLAAPSGELFKGIGRPHINLIASIAFFSAAFPALLILVPRYGPSGAALGMVVGVIVSGSIMLPLTLHILQLPPTELARALARPVACAAIVAVTLSGLVPLTSGLSAFGALLAVAIGGTAAYLVAVTLLARSLVTPIVAGMRRA